MFDIPNTEEEVARPRHTMKKKGDEEEAGRPVLSRVAHKTSRPSRKDRLFAALGGLSDERLAKVLSEVDPEEAALALLEAEQLICWSARGEQWTPTLRGLAIALNLPSFELGKPSFASSSSAKVA